MPGTPTHKDPVHATCLAQYPDLPTHNEVPVLKVVRTEVPANGYKVLISAALNVANGPTVPQSWSCGTPFGIPYEGWKSYVGQTQPNTPVKMACNGFLGMAVVVELTTNVPESAVPKG